MDDHNRLQRDVVRFLSDHQTHQDVGPVEVISTDISEIFLVGDLAFKMKRAVRFLYLDFSTLDLRHQACEAELRKNYRTAPDLYLDVVSVTRDLSGELSLDGDGDVVEWLVKMRRFADDALLNLQISAGGMRRYAFIDLADHIADFHAVAEPQSDAGGYRGSDLIFDNITACFDLVDTFLDERTLTAWKRDCFAALHNAATALDARRKAGAVKNCHGDMHLGNICLIDAKPTLFNCIEFNTDFSNIDVMYDLAFTIMDLDFHDQRRFASILLNRYLDVTGEIALTPHTLAVLPLFLSMRAAVRAHVGAAQAKDMSACDDRAQEIANSEGYLRLANSYLHPPSPMLIAVGGLSGSGKSRMARELAPFYGSAPGARVVRTDAVRKRISGVRQEDRLGAEGYTTEMHVKTFEHLFDEARRALSQGATVVLDAVFGLPAQRATAADLAREYSVPFHGLWIDAQEEMRISRIKSRKRNISDVTEMIAREQSDYELGEITWARIDSSGPKQETVEAARQVIGCP